MKRTFFAAVLAAALGAQATPNTPPPPQREPLLLRNATLHPVSGPVIAGGSLLSEGGRIRAIGGADLAAPAGARTVDPGGSHVYPGMVAADNLSPQKAAVLLSLALTRTGKPEEIQRFFDEY